MIPLWRVTFLIGVVCLGLLEGCAGTSKPVRKLVKPVDQTAEELVKIREFRSQGKTRAVLSPADSKQLKIQF